MQFPDLTPLFYLALIGLLCCLVLGSAVVGWVGYHLFMALRLYLGG